jgi:hypothetical protein
MLLSEFMMRIRIFTTALFFIVLPFTACVTGNKYHTYELAGVPSSYNTNVVRAEFIYYGQTLSIDSTVKQYRHLDIEFYLQARGTINNGKVFLDEFDRKTIYTEPYTLSMGIGYTQAYFIRDVDKIIFNKLNFRSRNREFDLRQNVGITIYGHRHRDRFEGESYTDYENKCLNEEELMDFRNSGIIDLGELKKNEWKEIRGISINYNNIDVIFKQDRYFTLEFDVTFTSDNEDYKTDNYSFIAKFNRKRYTEWAALMGYLLAAMIYTLGS